MDNYGIIFMAIGIGFILATCSVFLGAWITCRASGGARGILSPIEPKGEVFTVEDVDDIPFPESESGEAEARVQGKVSSFMKIFNGERE